MTLKKIFEEQFSFNSLVRGEPPNTFADRSALTEHLVLCMLEELTELMSAINWKKHRNQKVNENREHVIIEIADLFKLLISIAQTWGIDSSEFEDAFWRKSMVVRQRFSEEWMQLTDASSFAVVDIDGVLCNYVRGFVEWLENQIEFSNSLGLDISKLKQMKRWPQVQDTNLTVSEWETLKHDFRVSGWKRRLPVHEDAIPFLERVRALNKQIVLLTSRPIDRYPNIYVDTVVWLKSNKIPYDHLWWATDKADKVLETISDRVDFIVDDDIHYVTSFADKGLRAVWVDRFNDGSLWTKAKFWDSDLVKVVSTLAELP